jgi:hypothetical protein
MKQITECENVNWFHLTWGRDQWKVHVNTIMKPSGCVKGRGLAASKEGLLSLEAVTYYPRKQLYQI